MEVIHSSFAVRMLAAFLPCALVFSCMTGCAPEKKTISGYPADGEVVHIANAEVIKFCENYEWGMGTYSSEEYYGKGDHYAMQGATLSWEDSTPSKRYEVAVSLNSDMTDATVYRVEGNTLSLSDLYVNTTYYWRVTGGSGDSDVFSFKTGNTPRTIQIDGVSNTRDIGGKETDGGKFVRQGMVFRGGKLDNITDDGKKAFSEKYSIKTDLDLRASGEGFKGQSPVGESVNYINYSCPYYISGNTSAKTGIDETDNYENMAEIMRVFADPNNYPVYYHCSLGRDRTSMVTMLLLGLCGVSKKDIYMDYEMSFFSEIGCSDGAGVDVMVRSFTVTVDYIARSGDSHGTFQENCVAYLLKIGLTQNEIDAIRGNLLDE